MICLTFFLCLRPSKYIRTTTGNQAFAIEYLTLFLHKICLYNALASDNKIKVTTVMHLTFTSQKNGEKGIVIAHALSSDHQCYPIQSAIRQLMAHRIKY